MSEPGKSPRSFRRRSGKRGAAAGSWRKIARWPGDPGQAEALWVARRFAGDGVGRVQPNAGGSRAGRPDLRGGRSIVLSGRRRARCAGFAGAEESAGPHCRTGTADRASAGGSAFFSRSLAALGRDAPERRRAHLYAVVEKMIADESQGFLEDDANVRRLCALGDVSARATTAISARTLPPARTPIARSHPTRSARSSPLRLSSRHAGAAPARPDRQRQAGASG